MGPLSMPKLVLKRISDDRILLLSIFIGITIATTVMATASVYLRALERLSLNIAIDGLQRPFSNINTFSYKMPLTAAELERSERAVAGAVEQYLLPIQDNRERYGGFGLTTIPAWMRLSRHTVLEHSSRSTVRLIPNDVTQGAWTLLPCYARRSAISSPSRSEP